MKHAINELKALLETWGPQKESSWVNDIESALEVLEGCEKWGSALKEFRANITEWHNDPEVAAVVEHGIGKENKAVPYNPEYQNYPVAAVDPAFDKGRVVYGYHTNGEFIQLGEREFNKAKFHVFENRQELERFLEDDDLGELDPSKACKNGEENCESCQ